MALGFTYSAFQIRGAIRSGNGAARLPRPYPLTAIMSVIYDSKVAAAYHAPFAAGPNETQGFDGGNNFWSFSLFNTTGNPYSIGCEGTDEITAVGGITGRWTKNAMIVRGVSQNLSWYWDLPDLNAVVHKNLSASITFHATQSQIMVGSTPWINNEMIDGGIAGPKIWQTVLPLWAILIEAEHEFPVLPQFFPYLWSAPDTRVKRSEVVYEDLSKNGRYWIPNPAYPTQITRPGPSYFKTDFGAEGHENLILPLRNGDAGGGGGRSAD